MDYLTDPQVQKIGLLIWFGIFLFLIFYDWARVALSASKTLGIKIFTLSKKSKKS